MKKPFHSTLIVLLGNALLALTAVLFLEHSDMVTGGTTGLSFVFSRITGMPVWLFALLFNTAMLAWGWKELGRGFAMTMILSTFVYPVFLWLFEAVFSGYVLTENPVLCTVFTGLGIGLSLGIVIREGASTGGMDVPPLVLHKKYGWPVSMLVSVCDGMIILLEAFFYPAETVLWAILTVILYSLVLDRLLMIGSSRTELKVFSSRAEEIREEILRRMDRGVTMLDSEGGYSHQKAQVVLSVVSNRELPAAERIILRIDPEAFIVISRVSEVKGRGFTLRKDYPREEGK